MSLSFGQNEPLSCPKNAIFGGVIGVYFVSFFLEHPVVGVGGMWNLAFWIYVTFGCRDEGQN